MSMSYRRLILIGLISAIALVNTIQAATITKESTPIGYWKTIDSATGKPKSIVQIWKTNDQVLMGKVVKLYPSQGVATAKTCASCSGELRGRPIVGMVILSGLKAKESQWGNGKILDPENGKTYSCLLKIGDNGQKLNVHGYVGIPILGRSQTWERVDLMSDA